MISKGTVITVMTTAALMLFRVKLETAGGSGLIEADEPKAFARLVNAPGQTENRNLIGKREARSDFPF